MVQEERPTSATSENVPFADWVILELLGHRRLAGWLTEQQIAGTPFLRLDIPGLASAVDGPTDFAATQFYSAAAIYAITPTSEDTARLIARHSRPAPVQAWELEPPRRDYTEPDYEEEGPF